MLITLLKANENKESILRLIKIEFAMNLISVSRHGINMKIDIAFDYI